MKKPSNLQELLEESVQNFGDNIAFQIKVEDYFKKLTFKQVREHIKKYASLLSEKGIHPRDKVAIFSENCPEWPIAYFSIQYLGAIAVPIDAMLGENEANILLEDCKAKAIVVSSNCLNKCPNLKVSQKFRIEKVLEASPSRIKEKEKISPDDLAAIVYTSGTTGIPKGVMLSHRNIASNVFVVSQLFDLGPGDNFLSVLPLHHTFETTAGFLEAFYLGVKITYAHSLKSYVLLGLMQETKVTVLLGVPLLYQLFLDGIKRGIEEKGKAISFVFKILEFLAKVVPFQSFRRLLFGTLHKKLGGAIKFWVSGGAAINAEVIKSFDNYGITILQGYGLTESSPILTCCTLENNKIGSVGKAIPGVEIKIIDKNEKGIGEVIAKGPNIMQGYYQKPEKTNEVLKDGWLYTGDLGYLDKDGYLFITGRRKDIIVTASGVNVYPDELEFFLNKIPGIKESCVLGAKIKEGIKKGTEEVIAIIVPDQEYFDKHPPADDASINKAINNEIREFNKKIADYKRLARIIIRKEELPKTRILKIKRFQLRKEYNLQ